MKLPMIHLACALAVTLFACSNSKETTNTTSVAETPVPDEPSVAQLGGPGKTDSLFFTLERTPCFGTCKAYRIEVYRSGFVNYEGRRNAEPEGRHTARVSKDVMTALLAKAEEVSFFTMQDKYDAEVTDLPSTIVRVVGNGKDKKVIGRVGQPGSFKSFVAFAEEHLLPLPWKPVVTEP